VEPRAFCSAPGFALGVSNPDPDERALGDDDLEGRRASAGPFARPAFPRRGSFRSRARSEWRWARDRPRQNRELILRTVVQPGDNEARPSHGASKLLPRSPCLSSPRSSPTRLQTHLLEQIRRDVIAEGRSGLGRDPRDKRADGLLRRSDRLHAVGRAGCRPDELGGDRGASRRDGDSDRPGGPVQLVKMIGDGRNVGPRPSPSHWARRR